MRIYKEELKKVALLVSVLFFIGCSLRSVPINPKQFENFVGQIVSCSCTEKVENDGIYYYVLDVIYPEPLSYINVQLRISDGMGISVIINSTVQTERGSRTFNYLRIGEVEEIFVTVPEVGRGYLSDDIKDKMIKLLYKRIIWCIEHEAFKRGIIG